MSWAEDEGIDYGFIPEINTTVLRWENGVHETKDGIMLKLSEMTDEHLVNTIKYFSGLDTSCLERELIKRGKVKLLNDILST